MIAALKGYPVVEDRFVTFYAVDSRRLGKIAELEAAAAPTGSGASHGRQTGRQP